MSFPTASNGRLGLPSGLILNHATRFQAPISRSRAISLVLLVSGVTRIFLTFQSPALICVQGSPAQSASPVRVNVGMARTVNRLSARALSTIKKPGLHADGAGLSPRRSEWRETLGLHISRQTQ